MSKLREGFHTVTPYFIVDDAEGFSRFLQRVFDAVETMRHPGPSGGIMHAEARIGDSMIMFAQSGAAWKARQASCYLYLDDVDGIYRRGIDAGARSMEEPQDKPYGERNAGFEDAWGNYWWIGAPIQQAG